MLTKCEKNFSETGRKVFTITDVNFQSELEKKVLPLASQYYDIYVKKVCVSAV